MKENALIVDDVWKRYQLGSIDAGNLKEDMQRWWNRKVLGKPAAEKTDLSNDLRAESASGAFWALRQISFEVKQGEVFGIVGKNGAGKSTLLKLLSRISRPTRGAIRGHGTMAGLLEVGTGFHEELTGRENIFLNGNIMGMSNQEIRQKFDDIVDFSGVSRFLDTPVKRYSSGMYVRLAFAVAAHLNPDILLIDEVLSVGDAEFQEKCLAKMHEAATSRGTTILYVSHNIASVQQLCQRAILLSQGAIAAEGSPREVIGRYYESLGKRRFFQTWKHAQDAPGNEHITIQEVSLHPELPDPGADIDVRTPIAIRFAFRLHTGGTDLSIGMHLFLRATDECVFDIPSTSQVLRAGDYQGEMTIPGHFLNDGEYYVSIIFVKDTLEEVFYLKQCLSFEVSDYRGPIRYQGKWMGQVRPAFPIQITSQTSRLYA